MTQPPGPGKGLDRELIVRAALEAIDDHGLPALTMRGLGQRLGVEAMSLYGYVRGREDLLEAVVTLMLDQVRADILTDRPLSWQGYLQSVAHRSRRIVMDHPAAFPLVTTKHPAAPWLRPPLRHLALVEDLLATLSAHGLDDQQIVDTYRIFTSFLLGHLLLEAVARGATVAPVEIALDEGEATTPGSDGVADVDHGSTTARLRPLLSVDRSAEEFETALESLIDRLELLLAQ